MLDEITLGIVAILAGFFILIGWIPQIIQGYKTKKLKDVSKYLVISIFVGAALWLVYGIEIDDVYIIGVNIAAMCLTMTVLIMKLKYEKTFESIRK
ncbi:MAG: SemiSWEET family transporter [Crenarchaeota archaeon]|nr:SemiSWEET family transporter [Thermoproteota archaeon]MDA1124678.1 SemiSWEET family transporter [Thermoproteota archaeon]